MSRARRRFLLGAGALGLSACGRSGASGGASGGTGPLRFSVLSTESASAEQAKWGPFLADLSRRLGREIKPFYAPGYAPLVEAMRFNQTDAGWFSNQSGLEAVRRAGGEVFASTTHPGGKRGYNSVVIARKGSGVTLERILKCDRTLSFGMGDAKSTSGTLAPRAWLFGPRGLDPSNCFRALRSASHEANLVAVANGVIDAATNNTNDLERLARRKDAQAAETLGRIEVLWTSPALPEDPVVWRRSLDGETRRRLREALLGYGRTDSERRILTDLNFGPFQPDDDSHLLPVRDLEASEALATARRKGDAAAAARWSAELDRIHREQAAAVRR